MNGYNKYMGSSVNLLVVEDNQFDADLLNDCLEKIADDECTWSFTDSIANSKLYISDTGPDLILLDLDLPDSEGVDTVCKVIRIDPQIPIIVMTDNSDPEINLNVIRSGAQDFISKKDLNHSILKKSIVHAIERKRMLVELEIMKQHEHDLAMQDSLTALPNRLSMMNSLENIIQHAKRQNEEFALLFIDLDKFKPINDLHGHLVGDLVLKTISKRLQEGLRESDIVARIGGDEFVCILHDVKKVSDIDNMANKINLLIHEPILLNDQKYNIGCSIGVALYPKDGVTSDELLNIADKAMYVAKENGRNQYQFAQPQMNKRAIEKGLFEGQLRRAINKHELVVYYQPIVNCKQNKIRGCEALVRWNHPQRGMILPGQFIPDAEESNLIIDIGEYVIREAAVFSKVLSKAGLDDLCIHVNISASHFMKPDFVDRLMKILKEVKVNPNKIAIEITESILMRSTSYVIKHFEQLKKLGVAVGIDDFGTGYTSMRYLFEYPISLLKIDQSFVHDMHINLKHLSIVKSFVSLAEHLSIDIIAEGIETNQHMNILQDIGCPNLQGFYFSKALPPDEFKQYFTAPFKDGPFKDI